MSRGVARVVRCGKYRLDVGVQLEWADRPIGVFCFPAGDAHIIQCNEWQHEIAGGARRVVV